MAKDEKNVPDGTDIQPVEKAPDNVIQMPGTPIPPDMSAEEAAILAQEGEAYLIKEGIVIPDPWDIPTPIPDDFDISAADNIVQPEKTAAGDALRKEQDSLLKELDEKADSPKKPPRSNNRDSDKKAVPKEKPAKAPEVEKPKKEKVPRTPRMTGSGKKGNPVVEEPIAPAVPEPPKDAPRANKPEQIVYINLTELHAFKNHPFGVRDDAEMRSLVESVKSGGVNQPALVRPLEDGSYEIVAGHRRHKASELAGYTNIPCIVRNMTDDEAILAMTDDKLRQRSEILPSEKAVSLKMQVEAIKHQGARETSGQNVQKDAGQRSVDIVGERNSMNAKQVQRYVRLTMLTPDLLKSVDEKKLSFTPAVEISYIKPKNQNLIAVSIEGQQSSPSLSQAQRLRELDQKGQLNGDVIDGILCEQKKEVDKVILSTEELGKYFGKDKTPRDMKEQIMTLLDEWAGKQKELAPPDKKAALEK